jgi:hypothetical protein
MVNNQLTSKRCGDRSHRAVLPRPTALSFLGAVLANSPVKTNVKLLIRRNGQVNADFKA